MIAKTEKVKTEAEQLLEDLSYRNVNAFESMDEEELNRAMRYAEDYKSFLDSSKTEREAVLCGIAMLREAGFREYGFGDELIPGGNYYFNNRGKQLIAFHVGTECVSSGIRIAAAHCDSPRLDLKQHPLFEDNGIGYLKTHYYGGIRKYQWTTIPLALHGVVTLKDGTSVNVNVGDNDGDPVFVITDLLPHLAKDQNQKPLGAAFSGESLNILVGSSPYMTGGEVADVKDPVKLKVLSVLHDKYGMTESDFMSAELCAVPAGRSVDVGFDKWLLGGYGHDDRVCVYPELTALIENKDSVHSLMCILADKEEIGSEGITGMQCRVFTDIIDEIALSFGCDSNLIRQRSVCVSADVTAGFDPNYPEVYEKGNSSLLSCGVALAKYTGSGGKSGTNDASAELVGRIRSVFDGSNVVWQTAELGKVDQGGGGTVAKFIAKANIETIDIGVPVLSMHAPFEIISKADLYSAHKGFSAFFWN